MVGQPLVHQLLDDLFITIKSVSLIKRPFIIFQPKPGHTFQDGINGLLRGTLSVGIFDTEHKPAPMFAGMKPGIKRCAGSAYMEVTRGAGGKAGAHFS
jgi:hypothetical protein